MKDKLLYTLISVFVFGTSTALGQYNLSKEKFINDKAILSYLYNHYRSLPEDTLYYKKMFEYRDQLVKKLVNVKLPEIKKGKEMTATSLYKSEKPKLLTIANVYLCGKCPNKHVGAACAIPLTADGICVTNAHIFDLPDDEIKRQFMTVVMDYDGNFYPIIEVLAGDKGNDIAVFRIDTKGKSVVPYRLASEDPEVGSAVNIISHPDKHFYRLSQGFVNGYSFDPITKRYRNEISAVFAPGSSGAPIQNNCGEVVGMVAMTRNIENEGRLQMIIYETVPVSKIRELFVSAIVR